MAAEGDEGCPQGPLHGMEWFTSSGKEDPRLHPFLGFEWIRGWLRWFSSGTHSSG